MIPRQAARLGSRWRASVVILRRFVAVISVLSAVAYAQVTGFPADEHFTISSPQSMTAQQLLTDVTLARRMLESHPSAQANLALGRALQAIGENAAASQRFDTALELEPKLAEASFQKGLIVSEQADWSKAADLFRRAVAASPTYAQAHLALGEMLLRVGDFEGAASELSTVLRLDPASAGAYLGLGLVSLQQGRFDRAADDFHRALGIRSSYGEAQKGLARAIAGQHRWAEAAALLRQLVITNPNSVEEATSFATALANSGDQAGAAIQFAKARELSNREVTLLRAKGDSNWGISLRNEGKLVEAAAAFRRAIAEDPSYCDSHDNLGEVLWMQRDLAGAFSEFQDAVRCSPESAVAHNNLGSALLYYRHDTPHALEQLHAAIAIQPGFALAHLNLGKALAAQQNFSEAEPELRNALTVDPDLAAAHLNLGLVLTEKNRSMTAEARAELEKGIHLDPRLRDMIPPQYLADVR